MGASDLLTGDLVQARLHGPTADDTPDQWLVTAFTVTAVAGTVVHGSVIYPDGLDEAAGWEFDLISRAVILPDTLCEITALLIDGSPLTLMGKGEIWTDTDTGQPVPSTASSPSPSPPRSTR